MEKLKSLLECYTVNPSVKTRNDFYSEFFELYYLKACLWARQRSPAYFQDIVANVFLKFLKKDPQKLDLSKSLDSLVYTTIKNECISFYRSCKNNDSAFSLNEKFDTQCNNSIHKMDISMTLEKGLSVLSSERRKVLELKLQGFKEPEIAARLGITLKKVKNHTYRGKASIRNFLCDENLF